jgi:hypothetical protein
VTASVTEEATFPKIPIFCNTVAVTKRSTKLIARIFLEGSEVSLIQKQQYKQYNTFSNSKIKKKLILLKYQREVTLITESLESELSLLLHQLAFGWGMRFLATRATGHVGPEMSAQDIVQGEENCSCLNFPSLEKDFRPRSAVVNKKEWKEKKQALRRL